MHSYGQYCPVAKGAEIFADRWTPLILRELLADVHRFSDLYRGLPGISRSLLVSRLRQLERADVVERRPAAGGAAAGYHLTEGGRELRPVVMALGEWAARRAFGDPEPADLKPEVLMGWIARRVNRDLLPDRRVLVRFDLRDTPKRWWWMILEAADVSVCRQDPGFALDLSVTAGLADLYRLWLGRVSFDEARADGSVRVEGATALVRAFPRWLGLSPLAPAVRAGAR
ncbi:MAG: helix-turn-helix domain-containing protein [Acidimicrobiales bacterium]